MMSRTKQQIGGALIALLGLGFTVWNWYMALFKGYYYVKSSVIMLAALVLGLALIVFPGYKEERLARGEDISTMQGWELVTPRWKAISIAALIAGIANAIVLYLI